MIDLHNHGLDVEPFSIISGNTIEGPQFLRLQRINLVRKHTKE